MGPPAVTNSIGLPETTTEHHLTTTRLPYFSTPETILKQTSTAQMHSTGTSKLKTGVHTTAVAPGVVDEQGNQDVDRSGIAHVAGELDVMLHVAFMSLAVLCAVCFAVCVIMVALFFIVCKRGRNGVRQRYNKVPLTDQADKERPIEVKEESFVKL